MKTLLIRTKSTMLFTAAASCFLIFSSCQKDQIHVPLPVAEIIPQPIAAFQYSIEGANAPVKVNFINTSMNATSVVWDFGSGDIAYGDVVQREYKTGGEHQVRLTATGPGGTDTKVQQIKINDAATQINIISFTVSTKQTTDPDHAPGENDQPDLYVKVLDSRNSLQPIFFSNVIENVSKFPVGWSPNVNLDFGDDPGHKFSFQLWDADIISSDDLVDEIDLIPSDYITLKSNYPQTIVLSKENTTITLNVQWK